MGRSCYTCQGGRLGQAAGGFCSKSDRLTSPSPLQEADSELRAHAGECMKVFKCTVQYVPIWVKACGATGITYAFAYVQDMYVMECVCTIAYMHKMCVCLSASEMNRPH